MSCEHIELLASVHEIGHGFRFVGEEVRDQNALKVEKEAGELGVVLD